MAVLFLDQERTFALSLLSFRFKIEIGDSVLVPLAQSV